MHTPRTRSPIHAFFVQDYLNTARYAFDEETDEEDEYSNIDTPPSVYIAGQTCDASSTTARPQVCSSIVLPYFALGLVQALVKYTCPDVLLIVSTYIYVQEGAHPGERDKQQASDPAHCKQVGAANFVLKAGHRCHHQVGHQWLT